MADETLKRDANHQPVIGLITDDVNQNIRMGRIDDATKGLKVMIVGGSGTGSVSSVSIVSANGFSGTVATPTTTPAITLSTTLTTGSVVFVNANALVEDNNNFYFQDNATTPTTLATNTNVALSINTASDLTGTDTLNIYAQYDAYLPNSVITNSLIGLNTDGAFPGYTSSSSRGTGISPIQLNTGDMVGGYFGFGSQGASNPTYQNLGGMAIITTGSSTNNLGGELRWYTKVDGGSLSQNMTMSNVGFVGIGSTSPNALLTTGGNISASAWGTSGLNFHTTSATYTDTSTTANTTISNNFINVLSTPTLAATNTGITYTNAGTLFIQAQPVASGVTITNSYALYINSGNIGMGASGNFITTGRVTAGSPAGLGIASIIGSGGAAFTTSATYSTAGFGLNISAGTFNSSTSSGTITTSGINTFGIPTLTSASATTLTTVATVYIDGAPVASTGITASTPLSLLVAAGRSVLAGGLSMNTGAITASNFGVQGGSSGVNTNTAGLLFAGAASINFRVNLNGAGTGGVSTNASYGNLVVGQGAVGTAATGVHALFANVAITPIGTVVPNGATVTNTASLYIDGASTTTVTGSNYSFWSANGGAVRLDLGSDATGDLHYRGAANGGALVRLGIGTTGNVLTVSGGVPVWSAPAGGIPTTKQSTIFENSARFVQTATGGTATFGTNGVQIDTTNTTTRFIQLALNSPVSFLPYANSPIFTSSIESNSAATNSGAAYFGIGTPTVATSGITFTPVHIGFKVLKVAGVSSLFATQADGTTENASTALTTIVAGDFLDLMVKVNGTSSVDYYYRKNTDATYTTINLTSNMPSTSTSDATWTVSVSNSATASSMSFNIFSCSYER